MSESASFKGLSKSRVMAGLQCRKLLWWMVHEPAAPELEVDEQARAAMDRGTSVGKLAQNYVPGGVLINLPYDAYSERMTRTREVLQTGVPVVYEATFRAGGVSVTVDILERTNRGLRLTEVKSTTSVKKHHVSDVAVQAHVLRQNGLDLVDTEVMHLNRECTYPDLSNLFVRSDVTEAVKAVETKMPSLLNEQIAMLEGPIPAVPIGPHCTTPYECPFMARCWATLPPHHVSTLYAMKRRALELEEQGYQTIFDLPEDVPLGPITERQRRAVQENRLIVEPSLARALDVFVPPIAFLDFETVGLAVPVWNGCRPYDSVPVQFSCHVQDVDGRVTHYEWLAEGPEDPRPILAEHLVRACEGARVVVAYNAGFERQCIKEMSQALPNLARALDDVLARLVDLLPVVRNHIYHPAFGGSFSLKSVLPALVPEMSYRDLAIRDGEMATLELERLLFNAAQLPAETVGRLRGALLQYCQIDTRALVELLARLQQLARESGVDGSEGQAEKYFES